MLNTLELHARTQSVLRRPRRWVVSELLLSIRACRNETYTLWAHSAAVAATSGRLAVAIGLDARECRLAFASGLMHDVGKTLTCASTLFKPGPLDDFEREEMRRHPAEGAGLVADLRVPEVEDAVHCHHELFDGSGYPFGLRGREIPLLARVVSVADYYEAMRESRPYRTEACGHAEALDLVAELTSQDLFDPAITRRLPEALALPAREVDAVAVDELVDL